VQDVVAEELQLLQVEARCFMGYWSSFTATPDYRHNVLTTRHQEPHWQQRCQGDVGYAGSH
jgi:hypothetical protein